MTEEIKTNSKKLLECKDAIEKAESRVSVLSELKKMDELLNERTVLFSQIKGIDKWHEAYSAGSNTTVKLVIAALEKL